MTLKEQIIKANDAYRIGTPVMSDAEYDILLSKLEDELNFIEFEDFKQTLMEKSGSVTHQYVIGSLNKVKYGEGELVKWIKKYNVKQIVASEKLDGCSFVAEYENGKFVRGASRGDGTTGTDWTEKLKFILPQCIAIINPITIRGELVITDGKHTAMGYKNARNGVVGIMNEDAIVPAKLANVTALVYDMPSTNLTAFQIFTELENCYFDVPNWQVMDIDSNIEERLKNNLVVWKNVGRYLMDGIVISPVDYVNENVYHPECKIAFKVNSEGVKTIVKGIEWNISKGGLLKPVVLVEPTEIDGTTVQRVTGNNYKYLVENGIATNSVVSIIKSGEVIPKIIAVINRGMVSVDTPTFCPSCGSTLVIKGVDLACVNKDCGTKLVKEVASFLIKCGVENATEKSLINWGINTFDDLLAFQPNKNSKSEWNFGLELERNVFNKTKEDMFACMYFDGAGETNINKLISFFDGTLETASYTLFVNKNITKLPEGIGEKVVAKIEKDWKKNVTILKNIINDKRWNPFTKPVASGNLNGKTFLITGTLSKPRNVIESEIKANGGTISSSVNKTLDYLVCGDSAGSKLDKANKLGVKVINEDELKGLY